jgi:ubiquitin C-terminal hydrolase
MLQKFTSLELLTGGSQYKCEGCDNAARDAERAFSLFRLPEVLVLQIARFAMNGANTCKLDDHVEFESELDLAPYIDSDLGTGVQMRYKLNGVIVHYGSAPNEGHYAAYVNGSNGMWHFIDDAIVEQVEFSQVQASKAYMLFYSRC